MTAPAPAGTTGAEATGVEATGVEARIAALLLAGAVAGVALIAIGVLLMAASGMSPLATTFPPFDAARVLADLVALRPEGYLWAGIVIVIATPIARVIGEFVTFALAGDRIMALASLAILAVVAASVVVAAIVEG